VFGTTEAQKEGVDGNEVTHTFLNHKIVSKHKRNENFCWFITLCKRRKYKVSNKIS